MEKNDKLYNEALLSDASVLNTSIGVQLIDNFSRVDPDKACTYMCKAFGDMQINDLANIDENRQGLCRTLSRLCFNDSTFESAAFLLMRFASTEKEGRLYHATIELQRLFHIRLGATEASLIRRSSFIKQYIDAPEYSLLMIRALDCSLTFQGVFFHDGTEKLANRIMQPYEPNPDEVYRYLDSSVTMLEERMLSDKNGLREHSIEILGNHCVELCKEGFADIIIPAVEMAINVRENRWDALLDNLLRFQSEISHELKPEWYERYSKMIGLLTKDDFEFRFKRVEKGLYSGSLSRPAERIIEEQRARYSVLGNEFCHKGLFSKELLEALYDTEVISTTPFGEVLAKGLNAGQREQFVEYSVDILNRREKSQNDILIDFCYGLSDDEFDAWFTRLSALNNKRVVFAAVARRSNALNNQYTDVLMDWVNNAIAPAEFFVSFWSNFPFVYMLDEDIAVWMQRILELPEGTPVVLHILQSAINGEAYDKNPHTVMVAKDIVMHMEVNYDTIMRMYQYWNVVRLLLSKGNYPELADRINRLLIEYIMSRDVFLNSYEVDLTYKLLLRKYFDVVWEPLSNLLLSDGDLVWSYYRMKGILGSMIGGVRNEVGLLFENDHTETLMEWCRRNPEKAPERLMDMAPVFGEDGAFSKIVLMLIDEFGESPTVMKALEHNLGCYGWTGTVTTLFEKQIRAIEPFKDHKYQAVRDWSGRMLLYLYSEMEKEGKEYS